jgi:hypothetical protein
MQREAAADWMLVIPWYWSSLSPSFPRSSSLAAVERRDSGGGGVESFVWETWWFRGGGGSSVTRARSAGGELRPDPLQFHVQLQSQAAGSSRDRLAAVHVQSTSMPACPGALRSQR